QAVSAANMQNSFVGVDTRQQGGQVLRSCMAFNSFEWQNGIQNQDYGRIHYLSQNFRTNQHFFLRIQNAFRTGTFDWVDFQDFLAATQTKISAFQAIRLGYPVVTYLKLDAKRINLQVLEAFKNAGKTILSIRAEDRILDA